MKGQFLLVCLDEERAVNALPKLLGDDAAERKAAIDVLHRILELEEKCLAEGKRRLSDRGAVQRSGWERPATGEISHA